jgi:tetratricopeptide (TPR) repeat protein
MRAEQHIFKAELLLKRKEYDKVVESLEKAIDIASEENDFVSLIQARCFLGETLFMRGEYKKSREHFAFILENEQKAEDDFDDLLNNEMATSDLLISLIDRYVS